MTASRSFRLRLLLALALLVATALLWYARQPDQGLKGQSRAASDRGLAFLEKSQLETGELPTYAWLAGGETKGAYVRTPFTASQILHSLTFADGGPVAPRLRERAIAFLLGGLRDGVQTS